MRRLALLLVVLAVLATGCGHPLIPAADIQPAANATHNAAASSTGHPDSSAATVLPAASTKPMLGVNLYAVSNYPTQSVEFDGQRMISYIKNVLKANAVDIVWNLYAPSRRSNKVITTSNTLTAAHVAVLTEIAKTYGLKVIYRPLIFVEPSTWEGVVKPTNPAKWFSSYYKVELPYLKDAQEFGITQFVAETEMSAMNRNPGWTAFYKKIAKIYHGTVTYASWDGNFFPPKSHLQDMPALGVDFYEHMAYLPASASKARVLAGWESWFKKMPESVLERTTIEETGIEARAGAYGNPPSLGTAGTLDQKVQANWFSAACAAVHKYHLRGVFFWKVDLADDPASPTAALSVFEGRLGAKAIAACASLLG
jgi:hypothetical protein